MASYTAGLPSQVAVSTPEGLKHASSIQCEIPGHKRTRLNVGRAGRKDLDKVEEALSRAGAFAKVDPSWPAAANS